MEPYEWLLMRDFKKWLLTDVGQILVGAHLAASAWRAALENYQKIAAACEKDCETAEDYKTLYFHLKQVLKNELGE